ncbi:hypothetical protein DFH11DRAFT_1556709 [Phellopilus nigrolimitatus]|nr:hypothetical protein DFH11DRAFT_1556709 [Phellopilus nigrolimitatus]
MPAQEFPTTLRAYDPDATQHISEAQSDVNRSPRSSQLAFSSLSTTDKSVAYATPQSRRRTRSAARDSSRNISMSSQGSLIPGSSSASAFQAANDSGTKVNTMTGTPHIDHVLSFHRKISPATFYPDIFSPLALDANISSSHGSGHSYFQDWQLFAAGSGEGTNDNIPPVSSDVSELCDSDDSSVEGDHEIFLCAKPYASTRTKNSGPCLLAESVSWPIVKTRRAYQPRLRRSKSLPAIPIAHTDSERITILSEIAGFRKLSGSVAHHANGYYANNISLETMPFSQISGDFEASTSSLFAYEVITGIGRSAQNGGLLTTRRKLVIKPFRQLQKVVNRVLA